MIHIYYKRLRPGYFYQTPLPLHKVLRDYFSKTLAFPEREPGADEFNQWALQEFEVEGLDDKCFGFRRYFGGTGGIDDTYR